MQREVGWEGEDSTKETVGGRKEDEETPCCGGGVVGFKMPRIIRIDSVVEMKTTYMAVRVGGGSRHHISD